MKSILFFLISCFLIQTTYAISFKFQVRYSEAADVFELMDHVSAWHPGLEKQYRQYWESKFPISSDENTLLKTYGKIREKYSRAVKGTINPDGLFEINPLLSLDFFSYTFYSSKSIGEALKELKKKKVKKEDLDFLFKFYKTFQPKISQIIKESSLFVNRAKELEKKMKKGRIKSTLKKSMEFFELKGKRIKPFQVLFVWWPNEKESKVSMIGQNLIYRFNPINQGDNLAVENILEKLIMMFSAMQLESQKENIEKIFLKSCAISSSVPKKDILQKPLALVWGAILYNKNKDKKNFDLFAKDWSLSPWANTYAKMLYPIIESGLRQKQTISGRFLSQATKACTELLTLKAFL